MLGNCVASVKTIEVPDPPVPKALSPKAPFKVVVAAFEASPPQDPKPQPKPFSCTAEPTV